MKKQHDSQIEVLKSEIEEWKGKYLRALADYQNLEKRVREEKEETIKYAAEKIIHELLVVYDTFEKVEKHINDQGLRLGVQGFWVVLAGNGVKRIEVMGKKFDPHLMECVGIVETDKDEAVVEEVRAGYLIGDKLLRAARVKVGKKIDNKGQKLNQELTV